MARPLTRREQQQLDYRKLKESVAMQALRSANQAIADAQAATPADQELAEILVASKRVLRRLALRNKDDRFNKPEDFHVGNAEA